MKIACRKQNYKNNVRRGILWNLFRTVYSVGHARNIGLIKRIPCTYELLCSCYIITFLLYHLTNDILMDFWRRYSVIVKHSVLWGSGGRGFSRAHSLAPRISWPQECRSHVTTTTWSCNSLIAKHWDLQVSQNNIYVGGIKFHHFHCRSSFNMSPNFILSVIRTWQVLSIYANTSS